MRIMEQKISNFLAERCIKQYETEELQLELCPEYYQLKNNVLRKNKVSVKELANFIKDTRYYPYSAFKEIKTKKKNQKKSIFYDVKFGCCLYIEFNGFTEECCNELQELLRHTKYKTIILDLRSNTGGDLESSVELCNLFMQNCEIVSLQYKKKRVTYNADESCFSFDKIYILVGKGTMSSSEIFMASMCSNLENVIVLGSPTFQKNVGQINYINHKCHYKLTVTAYYWYVNKLTISDFQKNIIHIEGNKLDTYLEFIYKGIVN